MEGSGEGWSRWVMGGRRGGGGVVGATGLGGDSGPILVAWDK